MDNRIIYCTECAQVIPPAVIAARHYSEERLHRAIFCNRACQIAYQTRTGLQKRASDAGRVARSQATVKSNHAHPKRLLHGKYRGEKRVLEGQRRKTNWPLE